MLPWQHLLAYIAKKLLLGDITEKLTISYPCRGLKCKEPTKIFVSPRNTYCQKTNRLQSVQGYEKQRTHKIFIYKSKKPKRSVAMATLVVARYCQKAMEYREPIKLFITPRNRKVLTWQHLLPGIVSSRYHQPQFPLQ